MENEFFNIDFKDAEKLGILEAPTNETEVEKEETTTTNETKKEELETEEIKNTEENKQGEEDPTKVTDEGSPNISSSIAFTLADNGVLQTLDDDRLGKIKTTEDLIEAFKEDLHNQLDEQQKRVSDALNAGVEPNKIQQYEQIISTLDNVTTETLEAEGEQYENYRKNLIYQNYINKGFEESDAQDMVERSVESGKDVDDAKKALESLKKFYKNGYEREIEDGRKSSEEFAKKQQKQIKELETSIIDDDDFYTPLEVSKTVRKKIFDTVAKPIKQKDGTQITAIQQYMKEKPNEALKMFGTMYVLTEGFTKFEGILKGTVKKKVRESTRNLERLLTQTPAIDGSLNYKSGIGDIDNGEKIIGFDI